MTENFKKTIEFADFTFETHGNVLFHNGSIVALEPAAAKVLRFFLENEGRLILKEEILETVWAEVFTTEDVLKRAVSQIRRALGDDPKDSRFIETHHRRGYRFIVPPSEEFLPQIVEENQNEISPVKPTDPHFDCFIGRGREISFLQIEFRRVLQGGGQPVLIAGEPGIGKTQTASRFAEWAQNAENSAVPLRIRFFDYEASFLPAYDVFLNLLAEACDVIFGVCDKQKLRQTIENKLNIALPDELFSSFRNAGQTADASRAIAPLAESFVRLSRIRPLVLILDDIQWADETSRKIIGYLLRIAVNSPLMLIGLTRRGDAENGNSAIAEWLEKQAVYRSFTILELNPLSKENCRALIGEVFQGQLETNEIPDKDLQKLHTATGGNPYFLVETLRLLINERAIEKKQAHWHWRGIEDVPLPETVRMAARAKLIKLSSNTRELVECAAILGDAFQINTLELMLINEAGYEAEIFENSLDEAIAAQVLTEQNVSGTDDCQFYHTTLRRAVYIDLSPRRRKRLHARAMRAIEISHSAELERVSAALAAHAENAGDFAVSFQLNLQACRAAVARFDWLEASELLSRAERGATKLNEGENVEFQSLRGEIYVSIGRRAEAEKILSEAALLAEKKESIRDLAAILLNLGRTRILLGKYREAVPVLEKSLVLPIDDKSLKSAVQIQLASAKYALCDYEESCEILQKIIEAEDSTSYNRAVALGKLGWTRALQARFSEARKLLKEALAFHQTAGDLRERAVLSMCLNWCEYGTGNYEAAIEYAKQARREAQIVGEPYNESVAQMRTARARLAQGLYSEAEKILSDTWEKQKDLNAPHAQAETIWTRGRVKLAQNNLEQAAVDFKTSLEMILKVGDRDDEFRILIDEAYLQNALGNYSVAFEVIENAAKIAEEIGVPQGVGEALIAKTRILVNLNEPNKAVITAREAVRILEESEAGERWQAYHLLALALIAEGEKSSTEIENALRRSVELLNKIREQFSLEDELRRGQFTLSLNAPAKELHNFLLAAGRKKEAEELRRLWLVD